MVVFIKILFISVKSVEKDRYINTYIYQDTTKKEDKYIATML